MLLCLVVALGAVRQVVVRLERAALVGELVRRASTDDLTRLPNRQALTEHLAQAAPGSRAVVVVDLDGFAAANDWAGHDAGDALLVAVGRALAAAAPTGSTTYRTAGDEFAVLVTAGVAERCAERLVHVVRATAVDAGMPLTASVGYACPREGVSDPVATLADATAAMRVAKRAGGATTRGYSTDEAERVRRAGRVVSRLREAIAAETLVAHLQPVVEIATGRTRGLEVLARWHDDELGQVNPDEFVPLAEASGLVRDLDRVVLRSALRSYRTSGALELGIRLAVNAAASELRSGTYVSEICAEAARAEVPLSLLTVEVTESEHIADGDPALRVLNELTRLGITVAIDDFGTGYSSLSYLERLPARILKIDRSLVVTAEQPRCRAVLAAAVGMCQALELDVVAEGVEDEATAAVLRELGVSYGQGWLWAKALDPVALAAHVREQARLTPTA